jgi:uncharacterized protein with PQ loop repeat
MPNPQAGGPPLVGCPWLLIQYIRSFQHKTHLIKSVIFVCFIFYISALCIWILYFSFIMRGNNYRTSENLVQLPIKIVRTHLKPAHGDITAITAKTLPIKESLLHTKLCDAMKCEQPVSDSKPQSYKQRKNLINNNSSLFILLHFTDSIKINFNLIFILAYTLHPTLPL